MSKTEKKEIELKEADDGTEWETVDDPTFFKFDKVGDVLEGELVDISKSETYGFGLYTIVDAETNPHRFHGSNQLDDLMSQIKIGDYIKVSFIDTKNHPRGQMKIFTVYKKRM